LLLHLLAVADHMPPAFSQSALVVYCEKSVDVPDGLADGDVDEEPLDEPPLDEPGMLPPPAPLPLEVPDGLLEPELPEPLPLPPVWAAANAGTKAMAPTRSMTINLYMVFPPDFDRSSESVAGVCRNIQAHQRSNAG
jgi:hypothetical protein